MPVQVAKWDSARDAWMDEGRISLFSELSDAYLATFPTSGMTVNGVAYELPTWEHRTDGSGSSSSPDFAPSAYLGTPTARMWKGSGPVGSDSHQWLMDHGNVEAQVLVLPTPRCADGMKAPLRENATDSSRLEDALAIQLLPTPNAYEGERGGSQHPDKKRQGGHAVNVSDVAEHVLLPTPRATDGEKGGPNQKGSKGDLMLPSAVTRIGENTSRPSDAGKLDSDGQLHGQLNLLDALEGID